MVVLQVLQQAAVAGARMSAQSLAVLAGQQQHIGQWRNRVDANSKRA
jgi:hypothetical protein